MASSQQPPAPGHGRGDPSHIAPFLTHLVTNQGQLTLTSQNAGRVRKSAKSKNPDRVRAERRRDFDEPRFNIAATPRTQRRGNLRTPRAPPIVPPTTRFSRDTMIPDYPPPSFQEAISESSPPPFIVIPAADSHRERPSPLAVETVSQPSNSTSSSEISPAVASPSSDSTSPSDPLPPQAPSSSSGSPPQSPSSHQADVPSDGSDNVSVSSSIEVVDLNEDMERGSDLLQWETDRRAGLPLQIRVERELIRHHPAGSTSALTSTSPYCGTHDISPHLTPPPLPHRCSHCGCPKPSIDCNTTHFPSRNSPEVLELDSSPPSSPRSGRFGWKKLLAPIVAHDAKAGPSSPLMSPRSPLAGLSTPWASNITLPSSHGAVQSKLSVPQSLSKRKDSFAVRRLFGKGKERESSPEEDRGGAPVDWDSWEVVNRASVNFDAQSDPGPSRGKGPHNVREEYLRVGSQTPPAGSLHGEAQTRARTPTPVAFLNRQLRHSPQPTSTQVFPSSPSVVSLAASKANMRDVLPEKSRPVIVAASSPEKRARRPPPPPPPPLRRKAVSSSKSLSPTHERVDAEDATTPRASPPPLPRLHADARHAVPFPLGADLPPISPQIAAPYSHLTLRSPPDPDAHAHLTIPQTQTIPTIVHSADGAGAVPSPVPEITPSATELQSRVLVSPPSPHILPAPLPDSPPRTPTTPTHHYPGRPLPQVPLHSSSHRSAPPLAVLGIQEVPDFAHFTDLDQLTSGVIEGDYSAHEYEDLLSISEFAGPATAGLSPTDIPGQRLSTISRVELPGQGAMMGNRVKVKLLLMGHEVDKCCICLNQFKHEELAALGTNCKHAFHDDCLKRWLDSVNSTCPLCHKPI